MCRTSCPVTKYRPDIDGLRTIAVLPVVLFHVDFPFTRGGFVGVDVFFVISGYLITSIIQADLAAGRFSLARFYERRIRRILPALFVVIAATLLASGVLVMPRVLAATGESAVAATFFVSNLLFWSEAGYFDAAAYTKPLLHTWTLAIEEQFYLVVPLLLMAFARWSLRPMVWIGALTAASFALSALTTGAFPNAAYYLTPWRAWELGIGALLALAGGAGAGILARRPVREVAAALGLALILWSVVALDAATVFPGVAALAPTLGAALVIRAGSGGATATGRLLGTAPILWIGRRSYSIYLWHWPLIVFYVYLAMAIPGPVAGLGLLALSVAFAALSYSFVERPFLASAPDRTAPRTAPRIATVPRGPFVAAALGAGAICLVGGAVSHLDGIPGRLPAEARAASAFVRDRAPRMQECFRDKHDDMTWDEPCVFGDPAADRASVAIWGDSYGPTLVPALEDRARAEGLKVALYAHEGCPAIEDFQVYWEDHDCGPFLDASRAAILSDDSIDLVILTMRAQLYTRGWTRYGLAERDRDPLHIGTAAGVLPQGADRTAFFIDGLERTIEALQAAGKRVALVYPLPEAGTSVPDLVARTAMLDMGGGTEMPRRRFDARSAEVIRAFDALVARHGIIPLRLYEAFCDAEACRLSDEDGIPIFRDATHLTATTARRLAPWFDRLLTRPDSAS